MDNNTYSDGTLIYHRNLKKFGKLCGEIGSPMQIMEKATEDTPDHFCTVYIGQTKTYRRGWNLRRCIIVGEDTPQRRLLAQLLG